MKPDAWGSCAWKFIHIVTATYPEEPTDEDKRNYHKFFTSMQYILPCEKCKNNMENHLEVLPLTEESLSGRPSMIKWGIDFHNAVNKQTGKRPMSYEDSLNEIDKMLNPPSTPLYYYIIPLVLLIVVFLLIKKLK